MLNPNATTLACRNSESIGRGPVPKPVSPHFYPRMVSHILEMITRTSRTGLERKLFAYRVLGDLGHDQRWNPAWLLTLGRLGMECGAVTGNPRSVLDRSRTGLRLA